jgi:CheY-like chemotaxis protein
MHKKIVGVLEDLFFMVKINESAKRAGLQAEFVKSEQDALDKATAADRPVVMILDLNFSGIDPVSLIRKLKADESAKDVSLIGFVSHVQGELKQQAQEAGCDMVLARSAFSQNLPAIFKRHAG